MAFRIYNFLYLFNALRAQVDCFLFKSTRITGQQHIVKLHNREQKMVRRIANQLTLLRLVSLSA